MTQTIHEYTSLRVANVERQAMWCPDQKPDLSFRGCEIAGEVGELCELLVRDAALLAVDEAKLAEEIGDCFISLDLMGVCVGLPPLESYGRVGVTYSDQLAGWMGFKVGVLCNRAKKLERERHGWRGSRATLDELHAAMTELAAVVNTVAIRWGINPEHAIAAKFNATSEKVDLPHRLIVRAA